MTTTTAFATCDVYMAALTECRLAEEAALRPAREFLRSARRSPRELADYLVRENILTRFQADAVLSGHARWLVVSS
jgi:hypothetical protein